MKAASLRRLLLASTVVLAWGLPLAFVSLFLLLDPRPILGGAEFTVANSLGVPIEVTPVGILRAASGDHEWKVVPQLAVAFLAAPARRQVGIPVPAGAAVAIRATFDHVSLAAIAVDVAGEPGRMQVVDRAAAMGQCCYPPRQRRFVVEKEHLSPATRGLVEAVAKAREGDGADGWYAWAAGGLALGVLFVLSLLAYRSLARRADRPA